MYLKSIFFIGLASLALVAVSSGQGLADLEATQQAKLDDAVRRLTAQRRLIKEQQIPLARTSPRTRGGGKTTARRTQRSAQSGR
jgi:hypothetical protein